MISAMIWTVVRRLESASVFIAAAHTVTVGSRAKNLAMISWTSVTAPICSWLENPLLTITSWKASMWRLTPSGLCSCSSVIWRMCLRNSCSMAR